MPTLHQHMRSRLLQAKGIPRYDFSMPEIRQRQWSLAFENKMRQYWLKAYLGTGCSWSYTFIELMKNRLMFGALRYGMSDDEDKTHYQCMKSIEKRDLLFNNTGDIELLVDIANLALLEWVEGDKRSKPRTCVLVHLACQAMCDFVSRSHPNAHFGSVGENSPKAEL